MTGTAEQPHGTTTRISITRYLRASQEPKTLEHLRTSIVDEALFTHIAQAEAVFPGSAINIDDLVLEDTKAALRGRLRDEHHGNAPGVSASKRGVDVVIVVISDVNHDRVVGQSTVLGTLSLREQLRALAERR